tara:strand:- start:1809 stop:2264 length:456 start_codon:yes stop_codon:yes gene_type:complete
MNIEKFLNSKNVLYLTIGLAFLCSLGYLCVSSYECLAVFVVSYFVCCNYIKNKVICLLISLFLANFVFSCSFTLKGRMFEGMGGLVNVGPVSNPLVAGEFNKVIEKAGKVAGEAAANAAADSGASDATQDEQREKAENEVKKAVVEEFSNF